MSTIGVGGGADVVEKYGFYVAGLMGNASSDKTFRKFGAPGADTDKATEIMNAIQNIIPAAGGAGAPTAEDLDSYLSYSSSAKNALPGGQDKHISITTFDTQIPDIKFYAYGRLTARSNYF